jgi:hypothetical protein
MAAGRETGSWVRRGGPKVILGTKCPSIMSTWSQSAKWDIVSLHAAPRAAKSAERMEGGDYRGGGHDEQLIGESGAGRDFEDYERNQENKFTCQKDWR